MLANSLETGDGRGVVGGEGKMAPAGGKRRDVARDGANGGASPRPSQGPSKWGADSRGSRQYREALLGRDPRIAR
jgi:hypothetical protein